MHTSESLRTTVRHMPKRKLAELEAEAGSEALADDLDAELEAEARNEALTEMHGKLPPYAMWRAQDVSCEAQAVRYAWWKGLLKEACLPMSVESSMKIWMERLHAT